MIDLSTVAVAGWQAHTKGAGRVARDEGRAERERALVRAAQGGDRSAFETLYRENVRRVYALSFRLTGNAQAAEELTQDVFVRAWQKLGSFRGESAFSSWLHPLTINAAYSEGRARRRRESRITATDDLEPYDKAPLPARPGDALDLERALAGLPEGARQVFVMHDVYGYKHDEIAALSGIATGTSKAQLHRARRLLREALGR
jgi:RNA polymerase sigma-70 factor (ECF subfamily)